MTSITIAIFMVAAAALAVGYFLGALVQRTAEPDPYDEPMEAWECFARIENAVECLSEHGWKAEVSGAKDGTFVYYKLIAPAPKE